MFDATGNVTETHSFETLHTDTNGLSMGATDNVRRSVYAWYDSANRVSALADYGSGGATWSSFAVPTRPGTAPTASSSSLLLTTHTYNTLSGAQEVTTDPNGSKAKVIFDDLERRQYVVSNYVNFVESAETNTGVLTNHKIR